MMNEFEADAPLCSYVYVTVNQQKYGLFLAVEAVEDGFLRRNYGLNGGTLYKPDFMNRFGEGGPPPPPNGMPPMQGMPPPNAMPPMQGMPPPNGAPPIQGMSPPNGAPPMQGMPPPNGMPPMPEDFPQDGGPPPPGSSDDVRLVYTDENPNSYANIFRNAKTPVSASDRVRLIHSLKNLGDVRAIETVVDMDKTLRYFAAHNYVVNGDSYTGGMVHNYYLREKNGVLSMIPWDYNLAFGGFQSRDATSAVNDPIDSPLSVSADGSRPMADWIFESPNYRELYHKYLREFLERVNVPDIIEQTETLIAPYVADDPTAFCTVEEFQKGVNALRSFCELRTKSVLAQLDGNIPSTDEGQRANPSALIDASPLNLNDMGSMGIPGGPPPGIPTNPFMSQADRNPSAATARKDGSFQNFPRLFPGTDV